jgi:hypothetical protein
MVRKAGRFMKNLDEECKEKILPVRNGLLSMGWIAYVTTSDWIWGLHPITQVGVAI